MGWLADKLGLSRLERRRRARRLSEELAEELGRVARSRLSVRTAAEYVPGIRVGDSRDGVARIEVVGTVPNVVEQGVGPFGIGTHGPLYDVREQVFRDGAKVKTRADGWHYAHVPVAYEGGRPVFRTVSEDGKPWWTHGTAPRWLANEAADIVRERLRVA